MFPTIILFGWSSTCQTVPIDGTGIGILILGHHESSSSDAPRWPTMSGVEEADEASADESEVPSDLGEAEDAGDADSDIMPDLDEAMALLGADPSDAEEAMAEPIENSDRRLMLRDREENLIDLDEKLISSGLRLIHALPIIALVLLGVGRTFGDQSPGWWDAHVRPSLGASFTFAIGALAILVLVAHLSALTLLLRTIWLTREGIRLETAVREEDGQRFRSVHGHARMRAIVESAYRQNLVIAMMVAAAVVLQVLALLPNLGTDSSMTMLALGSAALMVGYGLQLLSMRKRFNSAHICGMLNAYESPVHPALPEHPFTGVIGSHMDPILRARVNEFVHGLSDHLTGDFDLAVVQERLLHALSLGSRSRSSDEDLLKRALGDLIDDDGMAKISSDSEVINRYVLYDILENSRTKARPFFRLYDRVRHRSHEVASGSRPPGGIWFDVDMENLVTGEANLFVFVHNGTPEEKDLVVRVLTPDFRPSETTYSIRLVPGQHHAMVEVDSEEVDAALVDLYAEASLVWQTLLPARIGEGTVTARLEDPEGNLVTGRIITVKSRYDLMERVRTWASMILMASGGIAVLSRLVPSVLEFLTL